MKIRKGFVSNSSSSSFICDITGHAESGYDASPADCGMVAFSCGHIVDNNFFSEEEYNAWAAKQQDEDPEWDEDDWDYEKPEGFCPICQGKRASRDDFIRYVKKYVLSEEQYLTIVKSYSSYAEFQDTLKKRLDT